MHIVRSFALVVLLVFFHVNALGQSATGDISGTVSDANSAVVQGARVTVFDLGTGHSRRVVADSQGQYRVASLPAARYRLTTEAQGFASSTREFTLTVGQSLVVNVSLAVKVVQETINVVASDGVSLQVGSAELGGLVSQTRVSELPLNGRNVDQLALLEPGVVATTNRSVGGTIHGTQININGGMGRTNRFLIDGTSITDTFNNGVGSAANSFLGVEAIQEFRVLTNSYGAEHGQGSGGVVNIVSKRGTNSWHGSVFEFLRNDKLDARNFFDAEAPGFKRNQFGFSLGGPIAKEKTFVFSSAEWLKERLGITRHTTVPTILARQGKLPNPANPSQLINITVNPGVLPYLNLFPLPNGRDFGTGLAEFIFPVSQPTDETFLQLRLDHSFTQSNTFFVRYTFDDAERKPPANYPAWEIVEQSRNQFLTLEDTQIFGNSLVNTLRASYARTNLFSNDHLVAPFPDSAILIGGRPEAQLSIGGMPTTGPGDRPPRSSKQLQNLYSVSNDMSLVKGSHLMKWGVLFDYLQNEIETKSFFGGRFTFPGVRQFLEGRPTSLTITAPDAKAAQRFLHSHFGVYFHDNFKLRPNLTLNLGLRWEFSSVPTEEDGQIVGLPDPLTATGVTVGKLLENQKANFAPRAGLAWDPTGDGQMVIRAGFGIFYDINIIPFIAQKINGNPPFNSRLVLANPPITPNLNVPVSIDVALPDFHWQTPHALHYNFTVERLWLGTLFSAAYAGARGINLVRTGEANSPVPQILPDGRYFFPPNAPRRNPRMGSITLTRPDGDSWYNALQLRVQSRTWRNMVFQGSYTFSRTIDESQGTISGDASGSQPLAWFVDDKSFDRGLSDYHRKHNFIGNWIWTVPFFKNDSGLTGDILGNWELGAIATLQSGNPFTPGIQADFTGTRFATDARGLDRPNVRPGFDASSIVLNDPNRYFNPNAFVLPLRGTFGNLGRNVLIGPGLATVDFAVMKNFGFKPLGESGKLQFRMEVFNLLNHANFSLPQRITFNGAAQNEPPIGNAGLITSTSTTARQIQFGLKLYW
jgi:hypothetical protein